MRGLVRSDPRAASRGVRWWILFGGPELTCDQLLSATCILPLVYSAPKISHLESKRVQAATVRMLLNGPEMALLTKREEICPKGRKQFRVRCLQPLSHPSATQQSLLNRLTHPAGKRKCAARDRANTPAIRCGPSPELIAMTSRTRGVRIPQTSRASTHPAIPLHSHRLLSQGGQKTLSITAR